MSFRLSKALFVVVKGIGKPFPFEGVAKEPRAFRPTAPLWLL